MVYQKLHFETAAKLRILFNAIAESRGVYLFDEFDSIGSHRGQSNEVGEIRRILNSFLQMIEQYDSDSIILAATADFFSAMDAIEQREWMDELRDRVSPPSGNFPVMGFN